MAGGLESAAALKERFRLDELPQEDDYRTVGGLVLALLGRVPAAGDTVEWQGLRFDVLAMDGHRVDRVRVTAVARRAE